MASSESLADTGAGGDGLPASASGHLPNLITTIVGAVGELEANLAIEQPAAVKRSEADTTNTPPADAELSRRSLNPAVAVVHAAIARLRRAARVEDETFATASNFDDGDVPSEAAAAMRIAMAQAQREGRRARWRVQVPCIALGIVLIVVGCLLIAFLGEYALFGRIAMSAIATSAGATGVVLFLMAVIPADGNLVRLASIAVAFSLLIASALIAATSVVRRSGGVTTQCTAESTNFECQEAVLDVVTPALNMIALFVAGAASARATFLAQRQGTAPRALLEAVWRMLARFFAFGALVLLMRVAITASGRGAVSIYAAGNLVLGVWLLLLAAVLRYPSVRIRIQSVLAARGEALLTAAAVAAFMGNGVDPSELISRAQGSFRAVPLSLVQLEHLQSNEPDAALFALSAPVALGQCDCFVSHSWTDDAAKKHEALLSWGRRFEREFKRAPLIWLDRICLPQDRIEDSLQLLPCYLAGCTSFLALAGSTYLSRLWCIVEIFVFVSMGALPSTIEMALLQDDVPVDTFDTMQARCFKATDQERLLAIVEAAAGGVDGFNRYVRGVLAVAKPLTLAELAAADDVFASMPPRPPWRGTGRSTPSASTTPTVSPSPSYKLRLQTLAVQEKPSAPTFPSQASTARRQEEASTAIRPTSADDDVVDALEASRR